MQHKSDDSLQSDGKKTHRPFTDKTNRTVFEMEKELTENPYIRCTIARFMMIDPQILYSIAGEIGFDLLLRRPLRLDSFGFYAPTGIALPEEIWPYETDPYDRIEYPKLIVRTSFHTDDFELGQPLTMMNAEGKFILSRVEYEPLHLLGTMFPDGQVRWNWYDLYHQQERSFGLRAICLQYSLRMLLYQKIPKLLGSLNQHYIRHSAPTSRLL